ncbi:MAG TPA: S-formylglutathione hydrolase [Gammaproteobacteria bacterium]|jgi:S-formylglutathione hydrolase|nr:S-formylglutathione hydrolase [Gammaproteobacteria bacterium]
MTKPTLELVSESRCFEGRQIVYRHASAACACTMRFAVYLPPAAEKGPVPAVYWLSGLTCTEENFSVKAGAQRYAAELGLALIIPDTSPRGVSIPGEDASMDVGTGAGFYVNATQAPWAAHYRMYDYIRDELVGVVDANLPVDPARKSISGHSMGGHGALLIGVGNPERYRSVSAFAPISSATLSAWGQHALTAYLGEDRRHWQAYDAAALIRSNPSRHDLLVDQGLADPYLEQLRPDVLQQACRDSGQKLTLRERAGYDHGYYFVSTFIAEHLRFHANALR